MIGIWVSLYAFCLLAAVDLAEYKYIIKRKRKRINVFCMQLALSSAVI
jgi:ABC-type multidrug transport system permease subunit